ncbi:hypothetical protein GCM10010398_70970 [Streptomyces fimbriatus]
MDTVTGPSSSAVAATSTTALSRKILQNKGTAYRLPDVVPAPALASLAVDGGLADG